MANSPYWQAQTEGFNRGMGNIASALVRRPQIAAMQQYRNQQLQINAAREQAMAQEQSARTGLLTAQTGAIATGDKRVDDAQTSTAAFMKAQQNFKDNPTPENKQALEDATTDFSGKMATFKNVKVGDLVTALGKTGALNELVSPNPNMALAGGMQGGAAAIANNQADNVEKANRPLNITGALMTPDGKILGTAPRNVPQGDVTVGDANTPPLTTLATGTPKPAGALPPSVLAPMFKQLLDNSSGGTNVVQAASALKQLNSPAANSPNTQPATDSIPTVQSQQDYDALPPGAQYRDSNGTVAIKKKSPAAQ